MLSEQIRGSKILWIACDIGLQKLREQIKVSGNGGGTYAGLKVNATKGKLRSDISLVYPM